MITTVIGRTFLKAYNERFNLSYTSKDFFENEYFELFFNHTKYMQWVTNSPFVQMKKGQKPFLLTEEERKEKLQGLYEKASNELPDASFALGYPASETKTFATTSGLVSDLQIKVNEEDIYFSWIGSGLGIGVGGGYNLLIDDETILLETFNGWKHYRKFLNDTSLVKLRGNQINSWNGQWLTYKLGKNFQSDFDFTRLESEGVFVLGTDNIEVKTVNWSNLFFSLSRLYPEGNLNSYIYSFGQTNKTLGFIPIYLKSGTRLIDVWKQLYKNGDAFSSKEFQELFGMHIKRACELGSIGLQALRPHGLKDYMKNEKNFSFRKEKEIIIYQSYKTWLYAMLSKNKEEITDYTLELAELIQRYRKGATGTERKNLIEKELWGATSKKNFITALTEMIKGLDNEDLEKLKTLKDEVHMMTNEEFGYFKTLLKFDYAFIEKNN